MIVIRNPNQSSALETEEKSSYTKTPWEYFFAHSQIDLQFCFDALTKNDSNHYIFWGDLQRNLFYISENMKKDFAFTSNVVSDLPQEWSKRIRGEISKEHYLREIRKTVEEQKDSFSLRYMVEDRLGRVFWIQCYGTIKWDGSHSIPLFYAGTLVRQDEKFVVDPLSNFLSRDTLILYLKHMKSQKLPFSAIGVKLNNITHMNRMLGRQFSDQMLKRISQKLLDELSHKLTFCRLSGVRCVAISEILDRKELEETIFQIRSIIEEEYMPFSCEKLHCCSFVLLQENGEHLVPQDFEDEIVALLKLARKRYDSLYLENSEENSRELRTLQDAILTLNQDVLDGMRNFYPVVQPVVSESSGEIIGGETLLRWQYQGKTISPSLFVPKLEETGLILQAGRWIFEQAVRICAEVCRILPTFRLSANLSIQQLDDEGFSEFVPAVLERYGLPGKHIVIELTESCMAKDPQKLSALIQKLQKHGIRFALDDFGTGYSSLRVMMQFPTKVIKLDRSLMLEMSDSQEKAEFINSIVYACHQFGRKVCMEGIETAEQLHLAQKANCDMIQGFYYYQPMKPELLLSLAQSQKESLKTHSE